MADQQPNQKTATQTDRPQQPTPPALKTVASKLQHAGGACLHLLACPSAAAPLLLTCICVAVAYKSRHRANDPQRNFGAGDAAGSSIRTVLQRSISLGVLHGGHVALQRIIDSQEARLDDEILENAEAEFDRLLNPSDGRVHFSLLQVGFLIINLQLTYNINASDHGHISWTTLNNNYFKCTTPYLKSGPHRVGEWSVPVQGLKRGTRAARREEERFGPSTSVILTQHSPEYLVYKRACEISSRQARRVIAQPGIRPSGVFKDASAWSSQHSPSLAE
ncbi:hypothetical protein KSP39_PZI023499 [Platanthera zijinensis]|uniref:Uncharacterized protein n=1 Tax=Platanthera zijinensis TaxID=2320716 RepID=A0AAP0ASB1_9ASPA